MMVTSSTTAGAFYANIFSNMMPIKAFGIFAGTLIPINFLLVITIFPAAVIFYENNIKYKSCCYVKQRDPQGNEITSENAPEQEELSKVEKVFSN